MQKNRKARGRKGGQAWRREQDGERFHGLPLAAAAQAEKRGGRLRWLPLVGAVGVTAAIGLYAVMAAGGTKPSPVVTVVEGEHCLTEPPTAGLSRDSYRKADSSSPGAGSASVNTSSGAAGERAPEGMVWIPGGEFQMGSEDGSFGDARPVHRVKVDGFWADRTEVTNAQFSRFVEAMGYVTVAERQPDPKDFPGAPPELLVPGSIVFTPPTEPVELNNNL